MALELIDNLDGLGEGFTIVNNNTKEQFVNLEITNGNIIITRQNGSTINVALPISDQGGEILSPVGTLTLGSTSGSYNKITISPIDYLYNGERFNIGSTTIQYLSNGHSTYDRIDAIVIDTTSNLITVVEGVPAITAILPTFPTTQILVGAVYVKATASPTNDLYDLIYSAFNSQQIEIRIEQGIPISNLKDLLDVSIPITPSDGQVLTWDNSISKWVAETNLSGAGGGSTAGSGLTQVGEVINIGGKFLQDTIIDIDGHEYTLVDGTNTLIDYTNSRLMAYGNISIDWKQKYFTDSQGNVSFSYGSRILNDDNSVNSVDWQNRGLQNSAGFVVASWIGNRLLLNGDPVNPLDAATKQFVLQSASTSGFNSIGQNGIKVDNSLHTIGMGGAFYTSTNNFLADDSTMQFSQNLFQISQNTASTSRASLTLTPTTFATYIQEPTYTKYCHMYINADKFRAYSQSTSGASSLIDNTPALSYNSNVYNGGTYSTIYQPLSHLLTSSNATKSFTHSITENNLYSQGVDSALSEGYSLVASPTAFQYQGNTPTNTLNSLLLNDTSFSVKFGGKYHISGSQLKDSIEGASVDWEFRRLYNFAGTSILDWSGGRLTTSAIPIGSQDITTKFYVDGQLANKNDVLVSGSNIKTINGNSIIGSGNLVISGGGSSNDYTTAGLINTQYNIKPVVARGSNTNYPSTYSNGASGVGATLTSTTNGSNGFITPSLPLNGRILIYSQTDAKQNGIYDLISYGSPSTPWVLRRSSDYDTGAKMLGRTFQVNTLNYTNKETYTLNNQTVPVVGTNNLVFKSASYNNIGYGLLDNGFGGIGIDGTKLTGSYSSAMSGQYSRTINFSALGTVPTTYTVQITLTSSVGASDSTGALPNSHWVSNKTSTTFDINFFDFIPSGTLTLDYTIIKLT